jgi:hypothetical protein
VELRKNTLENVFIAIEEPTRGFDGLGRRKGRDVGFSEGLRCNMSKSRQRTTKLIYGQLLHIRRIDLTNVTSLDLPSFCKELQKKQAFSSDNLPQVISLVSQDLGLPCSFFLHCPLDGYRTSLPK